MSATPGPLKVRKVSEQEWHVDAPHGHPLLHPQWQSLAIFNGCWEDRVLGAEVAEANARLFAAAPKLLALLIEARKWMDGDVMNDPWERAFTQAIDAAIAEAGELAEAVK